jgi:type II secretory pathway predicted ATPase ExeA
MNYIRYRIGKTGGAKDLFDDEAIDYIHHYGKAAPPGHQFACNTCLVYAYAVQKHKVDADVSVR